MGDSLAMSPSIVTKHSTSASPAMSRNLTREMTPVSDEDAYFDGCVSSPSSVSSSIQRNWSGNNITMSDEDNMKSDQSEGLNKSFDDRDENEKSDDWDHVDKNKKCRKRPHESKKDDSSCNFNGLYKDKIDDVNFASVVRASSPGQLINKAMDYFKSRSPTAVSHESCTDINSPQEPSAKKHKHENENLMFGKNARGRNTGFNMFDHFNAPADLKTGNEKSVIADAFRIGLSRAFDIFAKDVALQTMHALMEQGIEIKSKNNKDFPTNSEGSRNLCADKEVENEAINLAIKNDKRSEKEPGYGESKKANRNVSSSSFTVEGEAKELRTASQSQLCFGNVQVHSNSSSSMGITSAPNTFTNPLASLKSIYGADMMAAFSPMLLSKSQSHKKLPNEQRHVSHKIRSRSSSNSSPQPIREDLNRPSSENKKVTSPYIPHVDSATHKPASQYSPPTTRYAPPSMNGTRTPITSPEPKFFKPYKPDSTMSIYSGFLSQFGNSAGKLLNNPMYQALASGLMDKSVNSIVPGMNQNNCSQNRAIPSLPRNTLMHPATTRSSLSSGIPPVAPFFAPPPGFQNSPLAALYPGFSSSQLHPLLHNQFGRQNSRHNVDYFDSMRMPSQPSLRSGLSRNSRSSIDAPNDFRDAEGSPYSLTKIHEGLTPQHLKKAKLLFFYNRYPSANTLRAFFPDVNFDRAITSQLIKWFSNFREFFYIQMEKFARQALTDGIRDASQLVLSRDCELLRVLNLHYNKCNDFKVPSKFIKVTEASLREFFLAVKAGKDKDPSWKKVIYKVICKLDFEIPEIFKSPSVLDRLHEIRD